MYRLFAVQLSPFPNDWAIVNTPGTYSCLIVTTLNPNMPHLNLHHVRAVPKGVALDAISV